MDRETKWNLQDIKPAESRRKRPRRTVRREEPTEDRVERKSSRSKRLKVSGGNRKLWLTLSALFGLGVLAFGISALFSGAKVTVYPRFRDPVVNTALEAKKEAGAGELPFEILSLEAEGERQVKANGQEDVTEKATGQITIYNTTTDTQKLVKNTRFETADGLVFHIDNAVSVPAADGDTPGSIIAEATADKAGPNYNVAAGSKMTIPGFKESNLDKLYASVTGEVAVDMTGGYDGPRYMIDDNELTAAQESLHAELRQALMDKLGSEKPAGFAVFDDAVTFAYETLPAEAASGDDSSEVNIKEKTILRVPIFKDAEFASYIASIVVPGYEGEPVRIEDNSVFKFSYSDENVTGNSLAVADTVNFKLVGKPRLVWEYDADKLRGDLAGSLQVSLNTILGGYPAIERATTSIQPFWHRSFPSDPEKIEIIEVIRDAQE